MNPGGAAPCSAVLSAKQYAGLAGGFLALALYGSLVPFRSQPLPLDEALGRFRAILQAPLTLHSRSDWAVNILLFIPLSYLVMAALCVDRPWRLGLPMALGVVPACSGLSTAIEFTQLYFPDRTSALHDMVAESIGALLGTVLWLVGGQRLTERARCLWTTYGASNVAAHLFAGYLVLLILVHVMPLDLTISPVAIYHKYREGRVVLLPFTAAPEAVLERVQKQLWNLAWFLPVGLLVAYLPGRTWQQRRSWWRVLALGLAVAGLIELLQLVVVSRCFDVTDIGTGSLAILGGWGAVGSTRWWPVGLRARAEAWDGARHPPLAGRFPVRAVLGSAWLGLVLFLHWEPFDFTFDSAFLVERLQQLSLLPFADYQLGTEYQAFDQLLHKTLVFVPVGALWAPTRSVVGRRAARTWALLGALGLAAVLEAGQFFLPTRYASISDVLIAGFGAWLGVVVTERLRTAAPAVPFVPIKPN